MVAGIFELSDRAVDIMADIDPMLATEVGVAGRDHRWPDLSPEGQDQRRSVLDDLLQQVEAIQPADQKEDVAKRVLADELRSQIRQHEVGDHFRDMNNIASPFQAIKDTFDLMDRGDLDAWIRIIVRLETIDSPLDGYRRSLETGLDRDRIVSRRQVMAVIEEGRLASGEASPFNDLTTSFNASGFGDDGLRERTAAAVNTARAAYGALTDWLEETYLPAARIEDACGIERYVTEADKYLGMFIDVAETYDWAWAEVDVLWAKVVEVCATINADKSVHEVVAEISSEGGDQCAASVEEFIATMQSVQDEAVEQLAGTHFEVADSIRHVDVKVSPPGGALAPYYTGPSEDFTRAGAVWYPLGSRTHFPYWEEMSTAYHEGFPGHHLQVGTQIALGDQLSRYHRMMVWLPGSGEGWALYAERLMGELGFMDEPAHELGMLTAQLMRACRIVIDIGLHCNLPIPTEAMFHPGEQWTYDLGVEMLHDVALQGDEISRSEITRYLGWPGQAISYKVGEQVILDLRTELSEQDDFDLKAFHTLVLSFGSIGLDLLKDLVRSA